MKRFLLLSLLLLILVPTLDASATGQTDFAPNQLVIKVKPLLGDINLIHALYGTDNHVPLYNRIDTFLVDVPAFLNMEVDVVRLAATISADPMVAYAEPNYTNSMPYDGSTDRIYGWGGNDSAPMRQQHVATDIANAHAYSRGDGVIVAVLDTGVDFYHPEFDGVLDVMSYDFVDNDLLPQDVANGRDDDADGLIDEAFGHGTHVAGVIRQVAPESLIMALRVLDSDGRGENFDVANAISYAMYNGASVINLSLGSHHDSALLRDVIEEATSLGVVVVAAAGNLNSDTPQYPAAYSCAIGVAAVGDSDVKSSFSSYGDWVDIAAPGEQIYSTFPDGSYAWWSGTSMATPLIAGQAALLLELDFYMSVAEIGEQIASSSIDLNPLNPEFTNQLGAGRMAITESLKLLQSSGATPKSLHNGCTYAE